MLSNSLTIVFISSHTCTNKTLIFSQSVPYSCACYSVFITKASYPNVVVMLTCRYMTFWFHCKFLIPLKARNKPHFKNTSEKYIEHALHAFLQLMSCSINNLLKYSFLHEQLSIFIIRRK